MSRRTFGYSRKIIYSGADINLQDNFYTPLTSACQEGHLDIVQELIHGGADININDIDNTPLTSACHGGHLDIVQELIQEGADVDIQARVTQH